jgi:hypothetical protein
MRGAARRCLLRHPEGHIAQKRAVGCDHLDRAGGRTGGHRGGDERGRFYGGGWGGNAVKADIGRASQICPKNLNGRSNRAGGGQCFHKRHQAYRQAEYRTRTVVGSPRSRCPVEVAVGGLDQGRPGPCTVRAVALGAKAVESGQAPLEVTSKIVPPL